MRLARVIFMHGLGDTPHGWSDLRETFREQLPHVSWEFPPAPHAPVTCNGGLVMPSWMDLFSIPVEAKEDGRDDEPSLTTSVGLVHSIIDATVESGIPPERIIVGGFSQGGAMAFLSTLRYAKPLGGCVIFSGWAPLGSKLQAADGPQARTPFLVAHGTADQVVLPECSQATADMLEKAGVPCSLKTYPGMAHSSAPQEIRDLGEWLEKVLPP